MDAVVQYRINYNFCSRFKKENACHACLQSSEICTRPLNDWPLILLLKGISHMFFKIQLDGGWEYKTITDRPRLRVSDMDDLRSYQQEIHGIDQERTTNVWII
ncbi:uncharacterized protein LOC111305022 [Durio zibethinus]|uniref:Uncharacterized protein LOC111305022 n=1 Tax=Durio zibethinus TaxID=66656 RepID=A0A6P5ZZI2_DURZI|nr:uncharacterized protein LOC111305022 [Durio zibethinus]